MAENLISPEIIRLSNEINERIRNGEKIYNLTIGDFNPKVFPIPELLKEEIIKAYNDHQTNYPPANGLLELRQAVSEYIKERGGFDYAPKDIIVASGARPIIYSVYRTIIQEGDAVIYPIPSWNNVHYCQMNGVKELLVETTPENNFMPCAADIKPLIKEAKLIVLCSPQNPSGTVFLKEQLKEICEVIMEENYRRSDNERPVYLLLDQIYWQLTYDNYVHYDPAALVPEIKDYTVYVDGISKVFAATGLRVGWTFGPSKLLSRIQPVISHMGAWAPKAEQTALAVFLRNKPEVDKYLKEFKEQLHKRLKIFHNTFMELKQEGFNVDAIEPQGALYLTVKIDLSGMKTPDGKELKTSADIYNYILSDAKIAIVPFYAFGASKESPWYRISVGTCSIEVAEKTMEELKKLLRSLK